MKSVKQPLTKFTYIRDRMDRSKLSHHPNFPAEFPLRGMQPPVIPPVALNPGPISNNSYFCDSCPQCSRERD